MTTPSINLFGLNDSTETTTLNGSFKLSSSEVASEKLGKYFGNLGNNNEKTEENNFTISNNYKDIKAKLKKIEKQRSEREKILNTKSSNGLTYIQANEIIQNIQKKFQGDFHTWVLNEQRSKATGVAHYDSDINRMKNLMSLEDKEAYEKAEKACAELEGKFPEISDYYNSYRITSSLGNLELKDEYKK